MAREIPNGSGAPVAAVTFSGRLVGVGAPEREELLGMQSHPAAQVGDIVVPLNEAACRAIGGLLWSDVEVRIEVRGQGAAGGR